MQMVKQNQNENTQIEKKIENGRDITKNDKLPKKEKYKDGEVVELIEYNDNGDITNKSKYKDWVEYSEKTKYYENGNMKENEIISII